MGVGWRTGRLALVAGALSSILVECAAFTASSTATDAGGPDAVATTDASANAEGAVAQPCDPGSTFVSSSVVVTSPAGINERLSGDELEIVYEANDTSGEPQVWHASRAARTDPFEPGALVPAPIDNPGRGWDPALSLDGLTLVFSSNRLGKAGGRALVIATRLNRSADFGAPVSVGPINDDPNDEAGPYLDRGNAHLWFMRTTGGRASIWVAPRSGDTFGSPSPVPELNAQGSVGFGIPSDDDAYIYFGSDHDEDAGVTHIWSARRASPDGGFTDSRQVTELSSSASEGPTWLSPDGCRLYFTSSRSGAFQGYVAERSP
jgi:hypothetical protein